MNHKYVEQLKKYTVCCISDALDLLNVNGGLQDIYPLYKGINLVGPVYTIEFTEVLESTFAPAADYIDGVPCGHIVLIANQGRTCCTVWGDILTTIAQRRGVLGTIIDGCCRDVNSIVQLQYPIFSRSTYMKSGKNRVRLKAKQTPITISNITIHPGDIVCGDDSGVVVFSENLLPKVIEYASEIQKIEEAILKDIGKGIPLKSTRIKHGYSRPTDFA